MQADHQLSLATSGPSASGAQLSGKPLNLDRDKLEFMLMFQQDSLADALDFFVLDGGHKSLPTAVEITPFSRVNAYSGYSYRLGPDCRAEVGFAPLRWGGFVLHKLFTDSTERKEVWEIFGSDGKLMSVDQAIFLELFYTEALEMDPRCPILSQVYSYLCYEYEQALNGQSRTRQILTLEAFVRRMSFGPIYRDAAISEVWRRAIETERDLVLSWEERQKVLEGLFIERERILMTKLRAHRASGALAAIGLGVGDYHNRFKRLCMRPVSNICGFTYKYTIGVAIWFFQTVRGNIGYSMALAIYGPFTFYFITQPLNPHAMWAVGRVRSAYLTTTETIQKVFDPTGAATVSGVVGVSTLATSSQQQSTTSTSPNSVVVAPLPVEDASKHLGLPLSTDFKQVDAQSWSDRMSNFKNMQIGYEENMQFAARMGRLEQMELQLNFSMIVDSTWEETERYLDQVASLRTRIKKPTPEITRFLDEEVIRTRRLEMYIWDKLLRYILDHPYVVMDQSKEQAYRDYYMGRSILLLRDMTNKLSSRESGFKKPSEQKYLETVAAAFEKTRVEGGTILERLQKNTRIFNQADHTDGTELRSYMKRQWEILYLLQNKAQEASNFGLQMYTWSVRNQIWLLQSLYSAKRRELSLIFESPEKTKEQIVREIKSQIEPLYEQLFHMMNLEFASIKPEMSQRLPNDIESRQRKVVIDTVEAFITDRDKVLKGLIQ